LNKVSIAHAKGTTHPRDDVPVQEGEGAAVERGASGESHGNTGSVEGSRSVRMSDVGSQSSCNFGPSTITVSRIREMTEQRCFAEGGARASGEENIPEPEDDETILFEEFFTTGFRMPPHPVIADILLKFQVQLHQLTPNEIAQLSKYCWVVTSFQGVPSADGFTKRYELHH
jgi:hypothetical protein